MLILLFKPHFATQRVNYIKEYFSIFEIHDFSLPLATPARRRKSKKKSHLARTGNPRDREQRFAGSFRSRPVAHATRSRGKCEQSDCTRRTERSRESVARFHSYATHLNFIQRSATPRTFGNTGPPFSSVALGTCRHRLPESFSPCTSIVHTRFMASSEKSRVVRSSLWNDG